MSVARAHRLSLSSLSSFLYTNSDGAMDDNATANVNVIETLVAHKQIISTIKTQTWPMFRKLKVLRRAKLFIKKHEGELKQSKQAKDIFSSYKAYMEKTIGKLNRRIANLVVQLTPWEMRIKKIESQFGSVVASYFIFLRWVFWINTGIAIYICVFLMLPEGYLKFSPLFYGYYSNVETDDLGWDFMIGNSETAYNKVASIVMGLKEVILEENERKKEEATDWKMTALRIIANIVVLFLLGTSAYAVVLVVERSQNMPENPGWVRENEVTLVLTGIGNLYPNLFNIIGMVERYHPGIQLQWQLARILVLNLLNLYTLMFSQFGKVDKMLLELPLTQEVGPESTTDSYRTTRGRTRGTGRWTEATTDWSTTKSKATKGSGTTFKPSSASEEEMPVEVSTSTSFDAELSTTFRSDMEMTTTWEMGCQSEEDRLSAIDITDDDLMLLSDDEKANLRNLCWETMFGQELTKLTVMDLVVTVVSTIIGDFLRAVIVRYCNGKACFFWDLEKGWPGYSDFAIAENILHLVNNQGMVWLGMFYSPGLPGINTLKLCIMMYVRSWAVLTCNIPHETVFKVVDYLTSPGTIVPLLSLLMMTIYWLYATNANLKEANNDLKMQLRKDKDLIQDELAASARPEISTVPGAEKKHVRINEEVEVDTNSLSDKKPELPV
ncbi:Transmembrane channel-like protein 3 [Halotydeus destructor]|nr:Transmembrane channel-like protein 3 [Halotydeus destructor]